MLLNYLIIALRNLKRFKGFSFINIAGLAVGIACSIILFLFVWNESNFDTFNEHADQTYRVFVKIAINGKESINSKSAPLLGPTLAQLYPEVVTYTRVGYFGNRVFKYQEKSFREGRIYGVDSTFFDVFTLPLIEGDRKTALSHPNSLIITETAARRYFGNESPVGKILSTDNGRDFLITGLMKDFPKNSHFSCEFLEPISVYADSKSQNWLNSIVTTYVVLRKDSDPALFEKNLESIVRDYVGPQASLVLGIPISQFLQRGNTFEMHLQPLTSIYLQSQRKYGIDLNTEWGDAWNSDIVYSYIFSAAAFFILFLAVINFMNLTTARSERRAKEVGIRKTLGATQPQLIRQFLIEATLTSFISVAIAVGLISLILPYFNQLAGKSLEFRLFDNYLTVPVLICFTLFLGVLAGSYPAFYLSSFQPIHMLKPSGMRGSRKSTLRSALVIFQFAISILFFIGTMIIRDQLGFMQHKDLGFNKEQLIVVNNAGLLGSNLAAFKQELSDNPNITSISHSTRIFEAGIPGSGYFFNKRIGTDPILFQRIYSDYDFLKTYQISLYAGRFFSRDYSTDSDAVVINQEAMREIGGENPIGKDLVNLSPPVGTGSYKIIGVINDFHYESLHQKIRPMVIHLGPERQGASIMVVRVLPGDVQNTIKFIGEKWKSFVPNERFRYGFIDQNLARMYESEEKISIIATVFSGLAIFIACLGLFGLAAFVTEQRTKEIGIRKIHGASIPQIVYVLSAEFAGWVLTANFIAWPVAYYVMNRWLQNFAYRVDLNLGAFLLSGVAAMVIALATVSYQTVTAAIANPVQSLRDE
jgi:putative ABC transport system permease protein